MQARFQAWLGPFWGSSAAADPSQADGKTAVSGEGTRSVPHCADPSQDADVSASTIEIARSEVPHAADPSQADVKTAVTGERRVARTTSSPPASERRAPRGQQAGEAGHVQQAMHPEAAPHEDVLRAELAFLESAKGEQDGAYDPLAAGRG